MELLIPVFIVCYDAKSSRTVPVLLLFGILLLEIVRPVDAAVFFNDEWICCFYWGI